MSQQTVMVVEDETAIRDMLNFTLSAAHFKVIEAHNAEQAWQILNTQLPDLILLDWMLPGVSGVSLAERLRKHERFNAMPIIMLTARGEEDDQVTGFEAGADDYVQKPFSPRALVARINALLRRNSTSDKASQSQLVQGDLQLDLTSHRFTVAGEEVKLGPTEFKLMQFFMSHSDRVFTRMQLLDQVWGEQVVVEDRTVDVHIRRLRKILETVNQADCIQTIRGTGYRFSVA